MLKLIGIIMSVFMGTYVGILMSKRYNNRIIELQKCKFMCQKMITMLSYESTPTGRLIESLAQTESLDDLIFLEECKSQIDSGIDFPTAWKSSIEKTKQQMCLNKDDFVSLIQLSEVIGASDVEGQINTIKMYQKTFEQNQEEASYIYQNKGKLCRSLGVLGGIAMGIMFI